MGIKKVIYGFLLVMVLAGCEAKEPSYKGPSYQDITNERAQEVEPMRKAVIQAAELYASTNQEAVSCKGMQIPLVPHRYYQAIEAANMVAVDHNWLLSLIDSSYEWPVIRNKDDPYDILSVDDTLHFSNVFEALSGRFSILTTSYDVASEGFIAAFSLLKQSRYLIVNHINHYQSPIVLGEKSFSPGKADIDLSVIDLMEQRVMCRTHVTVETPEKIQVVGTYESMRMQLNMNFSMLASSALDKEIEAIIGSGH